ncbi:MAG: hypothetical protein IJD17_05920 [Clostridia bacterium]|nr:hypothetical protein [Clostridia bacterium]
MSRIATAEDWKKFAEAMKSSKPKSSRVATAEDWAKFAQAYRVQQAKNEYNADYKNYLDTIGKVEKGWLSPTDMQGVIDTVDTFSKKYKVDTAAYDKLMGSLKKAQSIYGNFKNQSEYNRALVEKKYSGYTYEQIQKANKKLNSGLQQNKIVDPENMDLSQVEKGYLAYLLSTYKTEDEYNAAQRDIAFRKKWQGSTAADIQAEIKAQTEQAGGETAETKWLKNYGITVGYSDSQSYADEIAQIKPQLEQLEDERESLQPMIDWVNNDPEFEGYTDENGKYLSRDDIVKKFDSVSKNINELEAKESYLERKLKEVQAAEIIKQKYEPFTQAADFEEKSKTDDTVTDSTYRAVNGLSTSKYRSRRKGAIGWSSEVVDLAGFMEPKEKQLYNYCFDQDPKKANEYFDVLRPILNTRKNTAQVEKVQKFADDVHFFDDILSIGARLVDSAFVAPVKFIGSITGDYEDNWAAYDTLTTFSNTIRNDTAQDLNQKFGSEWAGFAYNVTMSILDMGAAIALGKGVSALAGAAGAVTTAKQAADVAKTTAQIIMSSGAASQTMTDARERGLNGIQIAALGVASAGIEALTEKIGLDELFGNVGQSFIKRVGKQIVAEGAEEGLSNVLNFLADEVISGNESQLKQRIQDLMAGGASYEQATQTALLEKVEELGMDVLAGALSGGVFGTGAFAIDQFTTVHFSVPGKYKSDLPSVQSWVLEKFSNLKKSNITVKKLGTVSYDAATMRDAIGKTKNADQAVAFLAVADVLHKKNSVVEIEEGGKLAVVGAAASLNGNTHALKVSVQKMNDGGYFVNGVILDGEVIYDASAYVQQILDSQATEATDSGDVAPKLVAGEDGQDSGFDYDSLNRITQTSGQRAPANGAVPATQGNAVQMASTAAPQTAPFEQQNSATTDGDTENSFGDLDIVDLSDDNELTTLINESDESKYAVIKRYILKLFGNKPVTLSDGRQAVVDGRDAKHLTHKADNRKIAEISQLKKIFENARLVKDDFAVEHPKFSHFAYYETLVKYGNDTFALTVNVGKSKYDGTYHIYELNHPKKRNTADRINGLSRPVGNVIESGVPNNSISNPDEIVKGDAGNSDPDILESRSYDYTESKENWTAENRNEGSTAEAESLDSIVSDIEETFGVPINKGNVRQKKAAGIYKTKVQAIRIQLGNALPTICHELGHHLDRLHKLTQLGSIGEAVEVMQKTNPEFSKLYGENQQKGEAVAEFIREYMRDRTAAKQKYPKFFAEVVNALGEDLGKLNAISDKVNAYMYASMSEHIAANTTNRTNARRKKGGFAKRMKSTVDWVVKHMFEDVIAIRDVSEKAYKGVYDARKAATVVDNIINNGMTDVDGNYVEGFEGVSLKSILEPINNIQSKGRFKKLCESITGRHESSYDEFGTYLVLKRGLDLASRGIPIFGNGDPSMQEPAKIQQEIDKMEAEYPEFKEVADQLYAWEKALGQTYYVNTGAMSQADFDAMWKRDPHYVPFNRNVRQEIVKGKSSSRLGRPNSEIKRIKGGSEELFDPIENIVLRSALMVQNAKNGRIMQILALEVESGRIDSSIMEKISETKAGAINAALDQKADALRSEDQTDGSFDDVDLVEWTGQAAGENIVWATINGERVLYEVHDPELLKALLNSTPHQADILTQVIGKVNSAFKMATTGANLIWSITSNSFRDFATGYYYGSEGNFLKYTRDYVMAARDVIGNRQSYQDAKAAGMGYTSRVASPKTLSRVMLKLGQNQEGRRALTNAFNSIIEGIQSLSEVVEATPRLAEYKRAIQQGKSKTDAVYAASEVTLNFDRKGDWSKAIDTVYPFFNVQMQGLYKQAQMIADPTTRMQFIRRKVVSSFVMAAFVIAANAVLGGKDEYEKLSDYIKNNYYCFYIGNGKFIKIPKARELDVLESALERMGEIICYGNDMSDSFNGFAEYIFQAYAPLGFPDITALFTENGMDKLSGFFKPTFSDLLVLGSFAEIAYNENYAGSPIVPTQYQDLHATEQYDNKTSGIAKLLGRITKTSPMQLDHLMVSNTGFIGKLLKAYTAEDIDWFGGYGNQFTADVAYSNDVTDQFYDGLDEAEIDAKTYPDNSEYQARYQQYSSVSSVVSYFYKQAKADPENAREYRMLAVAYAEEFLEGGDAQSDKLNALYEQTGEKGIYPYRKFEPSYSQKQKDENGEYVRDEYDNTVSEEITLSPQEFLEYINTYNETIDVVYEEILSGITEPKLASKALSTAKEEINGYARSGVLSDVMIAREAGISAADYYQITLGSSTNGASGVNQTEAKTALNKSTLTKKQRSIMWDLMFPKAKYNPYGKRYY